MSLPFNLYLNSFEISNLFSNNRQKIITDEVNYDEEVYPLQKESIQNSKENIQPLVDLNDEDKHKVDQNQQIDLLQIDNNETEEEDEEVLEIPAFLRRQAN